MTKDEAMDLLSKGRFHDWNNYRKANPDWRPDLSGMDLSNMKLVFSKSEQFDLTDANLCGANLLNFNNLVCEYMEYSTNIDEDLGHDSWQEYAYLDLKGAQIDIFTKFPTEFHATQQGAVFVSAGKTQNTDVDNVLNVFISYAWANEDVVLAVDQWLRLRGLSTKIDKRDFFAGSRIRDEILRVMQDCDAVVIFYSEESRDKPWTQFERELVSDLEMEAKKEGRHPARIIYFVIDGAQLPNVVERNRIAVMAKGKKFEIACEELYYGILQIAKGAKHIDLNKWSEFVF
jgi:TIR domain